MSASYSIVASYIIVYPRGDRTELTVALAMDYEEGEYDVASSRRFDTREDAVEHMVELAKKHGLNCPRQPQLLD